MHIDSRIIHRAGPDGRLAVTAHAPLVVWPGGSQLALHHMQLGDTPAPLLRALRVDGDWAMLDLQQALPDLAADILQHHKRDAQGLIWFTFRGRWGSAGGCVAELRPHLQPLQGQGGAALALPMPPQPELQAVAA